MDKQDEILRTLKRVETKLDHVLARLGGEREPNGADFLDYFPGVNVALEHQVDQIGGQRRFTPRTPPR
jgi:hypothetical protein